MARGSTEAESLESWLTHKPRGGGSSKFLKGWKEDGHCDTWMHTARLPLAVWRHPFPMYVMVKDKQTNEEVKHVFGKKFTCHENESVLEHPWRDKNTGLREKPPERCGLCKFGEWLWQQCVAWLETHNWDKDAKVWTKNGKSRGLDPCTLLFDFVSDAKDTENNQLHAGGISNFFGQKDAPDELIAAMKKAKIRGDEAWKENCNVKCEYALCVVNNDDIDAGVVVATETQALGEAIKEEIQRVWKSQKQNIQKAPYCIQWEYFPKEQFSKKYKATALMTIAPNPRVLKLIRGEAPDLTELKKPFNQLAMRATLETHCLVKDIPWDDFFPDEKQIAKWNEEDAEEESAKKEVDDDADAGDAAGESDDDADAGDDAATVEEEVACDNPKCKKPMKLSASECPHCGHKYEVEAAAEPEPVKPKLKTRADVAKEKADAVKAKTGGKATAPKTKAEEADDDDDQSAEIPF